MAYREDILTIHRPIYWNCRPLNLTKKQFIIILELLKDEIKIQCDNENIKSVSDLIDIYEKVTKVLQKL